MSRRESDGAGENAQADDCLTERQKLYDMLLHEWEKVRQERDAAGKDLPLVQWTNIMGAGGLYGRRMAALEQQRNRVWKEMPCTEVRRLIADFERVPDPQAVKSQPPMTSVPQAVKSQPPITPDLQAVKSQPPMTPIPQAVKSQPPMTPDLQAVKSQPPMTPDPQAVKSLPPMASVPQAVNNQPPMTPDLQAVNSQPPTAPVLRNEIDISGRWASNTGFVYDIRQAGDNFTWRVMKGTPNETGNGKVKALTTFASWEGTNGSGSATGTILLTAGGPSEVRWSNGVIFKRMS